jgi:hypothetical protein
MARSCLQGINSVRRGGVSPVVVPGLVVDAPRVLGQVEAMRWQILVVFVVSCHRLVGLFGYNMCVRYVKDQRLHGPSPALVVWDEVG